MAKSAEKKTVGLRAAANRTLSFGMVRVGIGTGPALDTDARVSGTLLHDGNRVKQVYRDTVTGQIVDRSDLTTGYAYGDGFVELDASEVQAVGDSGGDVKLVANLAASEIPSEWITSTNLAWPRAEGDDQGYMLLAAYLRGAERAFIGTLSERGTTKVVVVRWSDVYGCVIVQTLAYHAQVRQANVQAIRDGLATLADPSDEMMAVAGQVFGAIPDDFAWDEVRDEYGERLEAAIREKGETGAVTARVEKESGPAAGAPDLLAVLKASLEGAAA